MRQKTETLRGLVQSLDRKVDLQSIPVALIDSSPFGVRESRSVNLSISMKQLGILQPIMVRRNDERYEVVFGDGRLAAAKASGQETIPCSSKSAMTTRLCCFISRKT